MAQEGLSFFFADVYRNNYAGGLAFPLEFWQISGVDCLALAEPFLVFLVLGKDFL